MISAEIGICNSEIRKAPCEGKNVFRKCSDYGISLLDSWLLAQCSQLFVNFVVALLCNFLGFQVQPLVVLVYGQPCFLTGGEACGKIRKEPSDISHNIMQPLTDLRNGSYPHVLSCI